MNATTPCFASQRGISATAPAMGQLHSPALAGYDIGDVPSQRCATPHYASQGISTAPARGQLEHHCASHLAALHCYTQLFHSPQKWGQLISVSMLTLSRN